MLYNFLLKHFYSSQPYNALKLRQFNFLKENKCPDKTRLGINFCAVYNKEKIIHTKSATLFLKHFLRLIVKLGHVGTNLRSFYRRPPTACNGHLRSEFR